MTDTEKAMLVVIANDEFSAKEMSALCYEIHKREMIRVLNEALETDSVAYCFHKINELENKQKHNE